MPVANTSLLGLQEDGATGKIVGFQNLATSAYGLMVVRSETYISQQSGALTTRRLYLASTSGVFLVPITADVTSNVAAGNTITAQVTYYAYGIPGQGQQQVVSVTLASDVKTGASGVLVLRAAASDLFLGTTISGGTAPIYNLDAAVLQYA